VAGSALADPALLREVVQRGANVNAPPDRPDTSVDLRAAASRFLRQYARSTVVPLATALAKGLGIDLSLERCSVLIAQNTPNGLVIDALDFDGPGSGPLLCVERPTAADVDGRPVSDVRSFRSAVYERFFSRNVGPLIAALDSFVRVSPRLHWSNLAECFALSAESALHRMTPQDARSFVDDRDDVLGRPDLPGVVGPNPMRDQVRWERAQGRTLLVRNICCICFTIGDRLGRYCPTCPLISVDQLEQEL
jgi:hypothetical protein